MATMPAGNLIGGNLVTPNSITNLTYTEIGHNLLQGGYDPFNANLRGALVGGVPVTDTRKLAKWQAGGITGKKVVWWGDSTTEQLAGLSLPIPYAGGDTTALRFFPSLAGALHYNYGASGATMAALLGTSAVTNVGGNNCNITGVIAAAPDIVILSAGINDYRANGTIAGASYTSATSTANAAAITGALALNTLLASAIDRLTAALPNVCIVLRMPAAFNAVSGGGAQTYFTNASVSSQNVQDVLRLAYRGDPDTSTPIPQLDKVYSNVIVWDSQSSSYPETAYPTASPLVAGSNDNLHPVQNGYVYMYAGIFKLLAPPNATEIPLAAQTAKNELSLAGNLTAYQRDASTPLDLTDWYPVYQCNIGAYTAGSLTDISFQGGATTALDAFGSASVGSGLCIGDVFVFTVNGVNYAVPVQNAPSANQGGGTLRWFSSPGFSPSKKGLPSGLGVGAQGFLYRHKYAFSDAARAFMATTLRYNVLKNAYRFRVVSAANGSITVSSIANEKAANGQQVHEHTLTTSDVLCLAGAEGTGGPTLGNLGMPMTSATQGAIANQQYTITLAGTDFRNFIGGQGYLLSST